CHQALRMAERQEEADRLALDYIVGRLSMDGQYQTLLKHWLPAICRSEDKQTRAEALGQTGKQLVHIGSYSEALDYLKQSLAIQREIGDKSGEGTTLNNISALYHARGDYETALDYLKQSLAIRREIGDVAGLCATLFNMGHIHIQNEEVQEALACWVQVYQRATKINLAQALAALENLAGQLGLEGGLDGWAKLAERFTDNENAGE
ncbi:MAG: tetratricopeptide repeat protein, partial [Candidatus Electrothrix sp. AUS4]|nr:tetratricopeptide repeat protein [Candidatus Electrothrix sp. AUS4]